MENGEVMIHDQWLDKDKQNISEIIRLLSANHNHHHHHQNRELTNFLFVPALMVLDPPLKRPVLHMIVSS